MSEHRSHRSWDPFMIGQHTNYPTFLILILLLIFKYKYFYLVYSCLLRIYTYICVSKNQIS